MSGKPNITERQLRIAMDALSRIDLGYRYSSGLTITEQAYGMRSEASKAMEDISRIEGGDDPITHNNELWPGQLQAKHYGGKS